jgi:DNA adenine methylase
MPTALTLLPSKNLTPPLKWAGGKRWLIPHLLPLWEQYKGFTSAHQTRLIEPFCGGLAVALGLQSERAILNDVNPHLINFYQQIQIGLSLTESFQHERQYYFDARERFNRLILEKKSDTTEAAQLFYYLNRTGYNGLCRFNQSGLFNVPFGQYKTITYAPDFLEYRSTFEPWEFSLGDFEDLSVQSSDFVYADPPYDVEFVSYSQGGFTWADQVRLAQWLSEMKCPVVASNQATERVLSLYETLGFDVQTLPAPRMIACTGDRSKALEMFAVKGF